MAYRLSRKAQADLLDIWRYRAMQSGRPGRQPYRCDIDRVLLLVRHPKLGRARDADLGIGMRSYPAAGTIIICRIVRHDMCCE
jgi:plasmid stabilization system protein ParE